MDTTTYQTMCAITEAADAAGIDEPAPYIGFRHVREDGSECNCGCQFVVGAVGTEAPGYEDYWKVGLIALEFSTEYHGRKVIAYTLDEIRANA